MSLFKFREDFSAGAFVQRIGTTPSSLTGLDVSSAVTLRHDINANARVRGIVTVLSGTTVASVTATGVASGDVLVTGIYMYADARTFNASRFITTAAMSVRADAFEIVTVGSVAPISDMPVAWWRVD